MEETRKRLENEQQTLHLRLGIVLFQPRTIQPRLMVTVSVDPDGLSYPPSKKRILSSMNLTVSEEAASYNQLGRRAALV